MLDQNLILQMEIKLDELPYLDIDMSTKKIMRFILQKALTEDRLCCAKCGEDFKGLEEALIDEWYTRQVLCRPCLTGKKLEK